MSVSVLITGHRGYIGSALVEFLRAESWVKKVVGYDIADGQNILDYDTLVSVLRSHDITVVVHLAALSSVTACNEDSRRATVMNQLGTRVLMAAMQTAGCFNIIYASTSSVYGRNEALLPYTEANKESRPCSIYGWSKLEGEEVIIQDNRANFFIFRLFNVVGTSGFPHVDSKASAGYDRVFGALMSGHITVYGNDYDTADGTCERDYVALKDVCAAFVLGVKIITDEHIHREIINIASNTPTSVKSLIATWNTVSARIQNKEIGYDYCHPLPPVTCTHGPRRAGDPTRVYGSNEVAHKVLGWRPTKKIEDIIYDLAIDKNITDGRSSLTM